MSSLSRFELLAPGIVLDDLQKSPKRTGKTPRMPHEPEYFLHWLKGTGPNHQENPNACCHQRVLHLAHRVPRPSPPLCFDFSCTASVEVYCEGDHKVCPLSTAAPHLARDTRRRWPPLSVVPLSPTYAISPPGRLARSVSSAQAFKVSLNPQAAPHPKQTTSHPTIV